MLLYVPNWTEPLELKGKVRWQKDLLVKYVLKTVGVQFDSFGKKKGMNPISAFNALIELEAKHAPSIPDDS